jgi:hypothetical protein
MMCESEKQPLVDQLPHPAIVILLARPEFFRMHGTINVTWRRRGARTFGPYYRLRYSSRSAVRPNMPHILPQLLSFGTAQSVQWQQIFENSVMDGSPRRSRLAHAAGAVLGVT